MRWRRLLGVRHEQINDLGRSVDVDDGYKGVMGNRLVSCRVDKGSRLRS